MRKICALFFITTFLVLYLTPQEIIENSDRPANNRAGRTLELEEVLRITDENADFYFESPGNPKVSKDGSIFIADPRAGNLLKFSPDGKFLKNLCRRGEGPAEIQDYFEYAFSKNEIYVYDFMKRKIIVFNQGGEFIREFRLVREQYNDFLGIHKNWLVFMKKVYTPHFERKTSRFYEDKMIIVSISKDGKRRKENYTFTNKTFYITFAKGGGMKSWDPFDAILDENTERLYVSCTREYLIHVLDLNRGRVVRRFRRKYKRIDYEMKEGEEEFAKKYDAPRKKYQADIKTFYLNKGFLWVVTSTKDAEKGAMIDVYNGKGEFIDNFFIDVKGSLVSVHDNFIFIVDTDEDENFVIKKYRISSATECPPLSYCINGVH